MSLNLQIADDRALISIVIPTYNDQQFIERTVLSAVHQTYRPLEIIIVDDGSTDATPDICRRLERQYPCIRYAPKANGGVAEARNYGFALSSGYLVAFLDADDLWHPTKIERQAEAMATGPHAPYAASFALHRTIDVEDRFIDSRTFWQEEDFDLDRFAVERPVGNGSSIMVRRDAFEAVGGYERGYMDADAGGCEDLDIELKLVARSPIRCVPEYLVGYRLRPGSMATRHQRMARSMLMVIDRHMARNQALSSKVRRQAVSRAYCYVMDKMFADKAAGKTLYYFLFAFWHDAVFTTRFILKTWPAAFYRRLPHVRTRKSKEKAANVMFLESDPCKQIGPAR